MKKLLFGSLCAVGSMLYSQSTPQAFLDWTDTTGSQNTFYKNIVKVDASKNVYVAGATVTGNGTTDIIVTKTNSSGVWQWTKTYDGGALMTDFATELIVDASGNVYVTGAVIQDSTWAYSDLIVIKYNSSGVPQWTNPYIYDGAASYHDVGSDIKVDGVGNIFVTGATMSSSFDTDFITVGVSSSGTQLWTSVYTYSAGLNDAGARLTLGSGLVTVAGVVQQNSTDYKAAVVTYTKTTGAQQSFTITGATGSGIDQVTCAETDQNGYIYVGGAKTITGHGYDGWLAKLTSSLTTVFQRTYDGGSNLDDVIEGVDFDNSGNAYVTGYVTTSANGTDFWTMKLNTTTGDTTWTKKYDSPNHGNDGGNDIQLDASTNIYVTGYAKSDINGLDYYTMKYSNSGSKLWYVQTDGNHGDDQAAALALDTNNNVIVTGSSKLPNNTYQYLTAKYVQKDIITPIDYSGETPQNNFLYYQNKGQIINTHDTVVTDVKFYTINTQPQFYIKNNSSSFVFTKVDTSAATTDTLFRVDMTYKGAAVGAKVYPMEQQKSGYLNYFLAHTPKGVSGVFGNKRLVTPNIYPNIDLMCSSNKSGIKYYYIVKPGGNPANIQIEFTGATSYSLNGTTNALSINTPVGSLTYQRPVAYQLSPTNTIVAVTGWTPDWTTNGGSNKYKFNIGSYTSSLTLVVEVVQGNQSSTATQATTGNLDYSTYYGGSGSERFYDIKVTNTNDRYITGYTTSQYFPWTPGTYNQNFAGAFDAVALKYTADDTLKFSTFYGGTQTDIANSIALKSNGDMVIVGNTGSTDLVVNNSGGTNQVSNGYYNAGGGGNLNDGFIFTLNNNGTALVFARYFGGSKAEQLNSVFIDASDNVYVCGMSSSHDFPCVGAYKSVPGSTSNTDNLDAIIGKFNSNYTVQWQTYYGGNNSGVSGTYTYEYAYDIVVDNAGHVIVAGSTDASDFPTTNTTGNSSSNMFFSTSRTGTSDGFIVRFNGSNSTPDYSTYLGGNNGESINRLVYKPASGELYFAGYGSSKTSFPWVTKAGAFNSTYAVGSNPFVGYMDGSLTKQWCTYFGKGTTPATVWNVNGLSVDGTGAVYVSGYSTDDSLRHVSPTPSGVYVDTVRHAEDGYITIFDSNKALKHAHYFGGSGNDRIQNMDLYGDYRLYVVGFSGSNNFPIAYSTADASLIDSTYNGGEDGTISRFVLTPYNLVGIQEIKSNPAGSVLVYPNPASQSFTIKLTEELTDKAMVKVYNSVGQMVYEQAVYSDITTIPCNNWSEGIYIVNLYSKTLTASFKIIKQ